MLELEHCPACGGEKNSRWYDFQSQRGDVFTVCSCGDCGHAYINPQPNFDELAPYYQDGYRPYDAPEARVAEMVDEAQRTGLLRHVRLHAGMRVLDYGCGSGDFLSAATRLGVQAVGIEPSLLAAERARSLDLEVYHGTLETIDRESLGEAFDLITLNHVLEHVPDPPGLLAQLRGLLKSDGLIWVAVPNAGCRTSRVLRENWHSAELPRHLHHFTSESMQRCVSSAGLMLSRLTTQTPSHAMANSISLILKHHYRIPFRLSQAGGILKRVVAGHASRRADRKGDGEALICEIAQTTSTKGASHDGD